VLEVNLGVPMVDSVTRGLIGYYGRLRERGVRSFLGRGGRMLLLLTLNPQIGTFGYFLVRFGHVCSCQ